MQGFEMCKTKVGFYLNTSWWCLPSRWSKYSV